MAYHRLLVLTNRAPIASYLFEEVRARGHEMIVIMTGSPQQQPVLHPSAGYLPDIDTEAVLSLALRWGVTAAIYASTTSRVASLRATAQLRQELSASGIRMVAHPSEVLDVTLDKWRCRQLLEGQGVGVPPGALAGCLADISCEAKAIGYPVVLKLLDRSGGVGTHVVQDDSSLARLLGGTEGVLPDEPYLVEKALEGLEYSVEVLISDRGVMPLAVINKGRTDLHSPHPMGRPRVAPWTGDDGAQVLSTAVTAARAVGGCGVLEFDIIVSDRGPSVLEINPRLGGVSFMGIYLGGYTSLDGLLEMALGDWQPLPAGDWRERPVVAEVPVASELTPDILRRLRSHPAVRVAAPRSLLNSSGNLTLSAPDPVLLLSALDEIATLGVSFVEEDDLRLRVRALR
ncbi:MAG TPA: ATP-grasp domain-containing protein [Pyrinomonadaceae bacterium]|nr:ATP-grasp domain-containing protein [Pyrinomonadaceae bacterium]